MLGMGYIWLFLVVWRGLGREVALFTMTQLVGQIQLCLFVLHTEIKPGLAGTP